MAHLNFDRVPGLGVLGMTSMYRARTRARNRDDLRALLAQGRFSYVDSATVYVDDEGPLDQLLGEQARALEGRIVSKVGSSLTTGDELGARAVAEYHQSLADLRVDQVLATLVHKAGMTWIDRDAALHDAVRASRRSRGFGICTNSAAVLEAYLARMDVDVLQVAVNLLDYVAAMPVMELARRRGIQVQARSVLSSGLLAGKYSETSVWQFEDSIRRRYRETPENLEIFKKRWKSVEAIDEYRRGLVAEGRFQGDLAAFAYQCMMSSPLVDTVIVGGSELPQVCANLDNYLIRLDNLAIDAVFSRLIQEWRAPFL